MRHLTWSFVIVTVIACGGPTAPPTSAGGGSSGAAPRLDLHCTPQADFDEAACTARGDGCHYQPPLICSGIDVDDETWAREQPDRESGRLPCTCVCEADIRECSMVP